MKIGIIGYGYVGKATSIFVSRQDTLIAYDIQPEKANPPGTTIYDVAQADIVFISVPTPMGIDGFCNLGMVESVVEELRQVQCAVPIICRSTVPPGTCSRLGIHFMPEFLTEANWQQDFRETKEWIVGWNQATESGALLKPLLSELLSHAREGDKILSADIQWISTAEAETVKYLRNSFLATKVAFFNEIEEFCQAKQIDFETVRRVGVADSRIGESHSKVPGPDGLRGFGGSCFPKDLSSLCTTIESAGIDALLLRTVLNRNTHRDRKRVIM